MSASKRQLQVRELTQGDFPAWQALVNASPQGSVYSLPEYLDVLCDATGGRFRVLGIERNGELSGGVALYEEANRFGALATNRLLLFYNGIVLARHDSSYPSERTAREIELLSALAPVLTALPHLRVLLHNRATLSDWRVFRRAGWNVRPSHSYVVAIDDLDIQFQRVERNLRRLINRCEREGFQYEESDDFDVFYALHTATHEQKGAPIYLPHKAFARYYERLKALGLARLCHVRLPDGGPVVASQLVLHSQHAVTHTVAAAADRAHMTTGANAFLRWQAFRSLGAAGYTANDLTDASLNPVSHFKSQFGGELTTTWVVQRPDAALWRALEFKDKFIHSSKTALRRALTRQRIADSP